jgi:hypothetical protein
MRAAVIHDATRPELSRKAMSFSPSSISRIGAPSRASSRDSAAGSQYCRMSSPITVPGPTRVSSSLSAAVVIVRLPARSPFPNVMPAPRSRSNRVVWKSMGPPRRQGHQEAKDQRVTSRALANKYTKSSLFEFH